MADETFEDLLDAYARDTANGSMKAAAHERQLILDYVWRLKKIEIIVRDAFPEWQSARDRQDWHDRDSTANNVMQAVKNHHLLDGTEMPVHNRKPDTPDAP